MTVYLGVSLESGAICQGEWCQIPVVLVSLHLEVPVNQAIPETRRPPATKGKKCELTTFPISQFTGWLVLQMQLFSVVSFLQQWNKCFTTK